MSRISDLLDEIDEDEDLEAALADLGGAWGIPASLGLVPKGTKPPRTAAQAAARAAARARRAATARDRGLLNQEPVRQARYRNRQAQYRSKQEQEASREAKERLAAAQNASASNTSAPAVTGAVNIGSGRIHRGGRKMRESLNPGFSDMPPMVGGGYRHENVVGVTLGGIPIHGARVGRGGDSGVKLAVWNGRDLLRSGAGKKKKKRSKKV